MSTTDITVAALKEMFDMCPRIGNTLQSEHSKAYDDFDKLWETIRGLGSKICATGDNSEKERSKHYDYHFGNLRVRCDSACN